MDSAKEAQVKRRLILLTVSIVSLVAVLAACEGGYSASGVRESSQMVGGRGGWIEKRIRSANGSVTQAIEVDLSGRRLDTEVTLEVEEGAFTIELLDAEGNVTLSVQATPGNPASGRGYMESRAGEVEYRVTAAEAKGVHYRLAFEFAD